MSPRKYAITKKRQEDKKQHSFTLKAYFHVQFRKSYLIFVYKNILFVL